MANVTVQLGDEYVQMPGQLGLEYDVIRKCAWVEKKVAFGTRVPMLSWSHDRG